MAFNRILHLAKTPVGGGGGGNVAPLGSAFTFQNSLSGPNYDFSVTMPASASAAIFYVGTLDASIPTSVTWDATGTPQACSFINGAASVIDYHLYGRLSPSSGAKTLRVTLANASTRVWLAMQAFSNVLQTSPAAAFTDSQAKFENVNNIFYAQPSAAGDYVTAFGGQSDSLVPYTTDQTLIAYDDTQSGQALICTMAAGIASATNVGYKTGVVAFLNIVACTLRKA